MKQNLVPEQYKRANKVLMLILTVVYFIFIVVELNDSDGGNMKFEEYLRFKKSH